MYVTPKLQIREIYYFLLFDCNAIFIWKHICNAKKILGVQNVCYWNCFTSTQEWARMDSIRMYVLSYLSQSYILKSPVHHILFVLNWPVCYDLVEFNIVFVVSLRYFFFDSPQCTKNLIIFVSIFQWYGNRQCSSVRQNKYHYSCILFSLITICCRFAQKLPGKNKQIIVKFHLIRSIHTPRDVNMW